MASSTQQATLEESTVTTRDRRGNMDYDAADPYQAEVLWSSNWPESIYFTQGGKLYLFHMEHSANQPLRAVHQQSASTPLTET